MAKEKVLVVYYSRSGKTKLVAEELRKRFNADIEELLDVKNRKGILGYIFSGRDAVKENLTELRPIKYKPSDYDLIIIGTPTWASTMTPAVRTYIAENKSAFKKLAFFATAAGAGADKTVKSMEELCKVKAEFKLYFTGKDFRNKTYTHAIEKL